MSHLVLVSEDTASAVAAAGDPEVSGSDVEQDLEEQRPLLQRGDAGCSSSQRESAKVTTSYSLIPDRALPAQVGQDKTRQDFLVINSVWHSAY